MTDRDIKSTTSPPTALELARESMTAMELMDTVSMCEGLQHLDDPMDPYPADLVGKLARAVVALDAGRGHWGDCALNRGGTECSNGFECGMSPEQRVVLGSALAKVASLTADLDTMRKYVAHNDEEYKVMKDVLRAEHAACQELRATVARLTAATPHDMNTCMDCNRPLVPCTCSEGCPGGMCPVQDCRTGVLRTKIEIQAEQIATLTTQRDRLRSALVEACDLLDGLVDEVPGSVDWADRIASLRLAADGSE